MSISLKPSALEEAIQKTSVVLFHAPWCGHCTRFKPVFEAFAAEAKATMPDLVVAKMNHDKYYKEIEGVGESLVAGGVKVRPGLPDDRDVPQGEMSLYTGSRESTGALFEGVRRFVADVDRNGPSVVVDAEEELLSVDEEVGGARPRTTWSVSATKSLVLLYAPWCGHCTRTMPEFEKAKALLEGSGIETGQGQLRPPRRGNQGEEDRRQHVRDHRAQGRRGLGRGGLPHHPHVLRDARRQVHGAEDRQGHGRHGAELIVTTYA